MPSSAETRAGLLVPVALLLVILGAAALRAWNLDFGRPLDLHPDEEVKVHLARALATEGLVDREYFNHPYLLPDMVAVFGATATAAGVVDQDIEGWTMAARGLVAFLGSLTAGAVFLLARETCRGGGAGPRREAAAGLVAAALVAVAPIHVVHSRYVKEDVALALWLTLGAWACVRLARSGARRDLLLVGAFCGLALSTKLVGGVFLLVGAASALAGRRSAPVDRRPGPWFPAAALGVLPAAVFLAANLPAFLFPASASVDLADELRHAAGSVVHPPVSPWSEGWTYHLRGSLLPGLTLPGLAAGLAGLGALAWSREPGRLVLVFAAATWYVVLEASPLKPIPNAERYMVPTAVFLAAAAGTLIALRPAPGATGAARLLPLVALLPAVAVGTCAEVSVRRTREISPDTRERILPWIRESLPRRAVVVSDHYGLPERGVGGVTVHGLALRGAGSAYAEGVDPSDWTVEIAEPGVPPRRVPVHAVVTSSFWSGAWVPLEQGASDLAVQARAFHARVERDLGPPAATFAAPSGAWAFHNPELRVYLTPHGAREPR